MIQKMIVRTACAMACMAQVLVACTDGDDTPPMNHANDSAQVAVTFDYTVKNSLFTKDWKANDGIALYRTLATTKCEYICGNEQDGELTFRAKKLGMPDGATMGYAVAPWTVAPTNLQGLQGEGITLNVPGTVDYPMAQAYTDDASHVKSNLLMTGQYPSMEDGLNMTMHSGVISVVINLSTAYEPTSLSLVSEEAVFVGQETLSLKDGLLTMNPKSYVNELMLSVDSTASMRKFVAYFPVPAQNLEGKTLTWRLMTKSGANFDVDMEGMDFVAGQHIPVTINDFDLLNPSLEIGKITAISFSLGGIDIHLESDAERFLTNEEYISSGADLSNVVFDFELENDAKLYVRKIVNGASVDEEIVSGTTAVDLRTATKLIVKGVGLQPTEYTLNFKRTDYEVPVNPEALQQTYYGGGVCKGLYTGHLYSKTEAQQAMVYDWTFKEGGVKYFQFYVHYRPGGTYIKKGKEYSSDDYYDEVGDMMARAKAANPDSKLVFVTNDWPQDMKIPTPPDGQVWDEEPVGVSWDIGDDVGIINYFDPEIYDKAAVYMVELMNTMYERGHTIEIFNIANEPDIGKYMRWGNKKNMHGLGQYVQEVIPKFKELMTNPAYNKYNLPVPKIMGPSVCITHNVLSYMRSWRSDYKIAWDNIDILAIHQYGGSFRDGVYTEILSMLDGKEFFQSEMHTNRGDNLGSGWMEENYDDKSIRGILSQAQLMQVCLNNGVHSWFYFMYNHSSTSPGRNSAGLIGTSWGTGSDPVRPKQYFAFKQINTLAGDNPKVLKTVNPASAPDGPLIQVAMRQPGANEFVIHLGNVREQEQVVYLPVNGRKVKGYRAYQTDADSDMELVENITYDAARDGAVLHVGPLALTSFVVVME